MTITKLMVFTICLVAAFDSHAANVLVQAAELVGYGIFESSSAHEYQPSNKTTYGRDSVSGVQFIEYTNRIPGELGIGFGIQYVVNTTPRGRPITVTQVLRFPQGGLQEPGGRLYEVSRETSQIVIGKKAFYGFAFDEPWEIIPGEWTFEIWHKDALIVKKTFTVLPPA